MSNHSYQIYVRFVADVLINILNFGYGQLWSSSMPLLILVVIMFIVSILIYKYIRYRNIVNRIAGPRVSSFFLGNIEMFIKPPNLTMVQFVKEIHKLFDQLCLKYHDEGVFRIWMGPFHSIFVLTNADSIERLLSSSVNLNKAWEYHFLSPWLGNGLLLASTSTWRAKRKLLTPVFHFKMLDNFIPIFSRHTDSLLDEIERKLTTQNGLENTIADICPIFENCTLNIINETSMGIQNIEETGEQDLNRSYRLALKKAFRSASYRIYQPLYWFDRIYYFTKSGRLFQKNVETMNNYTDNIINKRSKMLNKNNPKLTDHQQDKEGNSAIFLDILLKLHNNIGLENIRSEVNTFILGGHDTTAMALTFTIFMLGHHPQIQCQVFDELTQIFSDDFTRHITMEDLRQMKLLERCIKETLRLYPSVQLIGRRLTKNLILANGKVIPSQSNCYVPIVAIHRNAAYFSDPDQFRPDRFLLENQLAGNPYSYIPFSAGPRNCIGQKYAMVELKYILASLLRLYRVCSLIDQQEIVKELTAVIKPLVSIAIQFERRGN